VSLTAGVLDEIFSSLDELTRRLGLEKIKTIGDAYMVVGGLPEPRPDHAEAVLELALAMQAEMTRWCEATGLNLGLRTGIASGPVVAGVIGRHRFLYDLWGDTVNIASRMESHGVVGRVQVTEATTRLAADRYHLESRGDIAVKGKGRLAAYLVWPQAAWVGADRVARVGTLMPVRNPAARLDPAATVGSQQPEGSHQ